MISRRAFTLVTTLLLLAFRDTYCNNLTGQEKDVHVSQHVESTYVDRSCPLPVIESNLGDDMTSQQMEVTPCFYDRTIVCI